MILSKSQLVNNINTDISDQSYGEISPYDIRHNLLDIVDSIHNLTLSQELTALNFSTTSTGITKVGQLALESSKLDGSTNNHNTAVGYEALRSSYQNSKNTAIGSQSLSCNVYGEHNVALGYNALGGNTVGHFNIGIGNFTLNNNKGGAGNIAIGHGAGYYASRNDTSKLFIGYHPINEEYICNNPNGSGLIPLIYGDLTDLKLGIGVRNLHSYGKLQVGGDITASGNAIYNLGHNLYNWKNLYLAESIYFNNSSSISSDGSFKISVNGSLAPSGNNAYTLGEVAKKWSTGYFQNLVVDGTASINQLISFSTQSYTNKILYLAVNSILQPTYSDEQLVYGGLALKSNNSREYNLSYFPPSSGMSSFTGEYNKSAWRSNISFEVPSGGYLKSNSLVSYNPTSASENDCYGLFFNSGITYISRKNVLTVNPTSTAGHMAGVGNFNLISNSGEINNYSVSLMSLESGVNVSQRFLTGTKVRLKDSANSNKDKLSGFEIKYIDDARLQAVGTLTDRLVIGSYNNTSEFVNGISLLKDSSDGSVFCITNLPSVTENILPNTIFNVRSKDNCIGRFTAESNGYYKSAIQLVGTNNCSDSGVEISYLNNSGISDISMYKSSTNTIFIRMKDTQEIGILSSGITNATITIGNSGMAKLPVISLKDNTFVTDAAVVSSSGYGKLYNLSDARPYADQYNSLFYMDCSGNIFNTIVNKLDNIDARSVYTDGSGNTFAGYLSPSGRKINAAIKNNSSYGSQALYSIKSGSGNLALGNNSLYSLAFGNNNIVIGDTSASGLVSSYNNIVIGNSTFNKTTQLSNTSGNIIIGHNLGASQSGSYNFLVGSREQIILLEGKLGPTNDDKKLILPSGGKLYINNNNDTESLGLKANTIEVIDSGGTNYPDSSLTFKFIGNNSSDLFILNHNSNPLSNNPTYDGSSRPYAELNGDFRIKGFVRFSDGTSLNTSSGITNATNLANSGIALGNSGIAIGNSGIAKINAMFIEGFMPNGLQAPISSSSKTSGVLVSKNSSWTDSTSYYVINRDITSVIHSGAYVIAAMINNEYKPIWISAKDTACVCCNH